MPLLKRVSCLAGTDVAGGGGDVAALSAGGDAARTWSLAGMLSRAMLSRALNGVVTLGLARDFTGVWIAELLDAGVC